MPTAIMLTGKNIDVISETLGIDKRTVLDRWREALVEEPALGPTYYVKDVLYMSSRMPYLIYIERVFLEDFASIPEGIQDRFVPVTQIKAGP
jgi:hypothetical protein